MLDMLILGVPFAAIAAGGVFGYIPDKWFIHSYVTGGILIFLLLVRQLRRFRVLKCPRCSDRLTVDALRENEKISFTCEACKIIWRTDFVHSTD